MTSDESSERTDHDTAGAEREAHGADANEPAGTGTESTESASPGTTEAPGPDEVYCRNCGDIISEKAEICPECGVRQKPAAGFGNQSGIAAVASLVIPGAGQIYLGHLNRGILFIVASMIAGFMSMFLIGIPFLIGIWLYAIYDAYRLAEDGAAERPGPT